jgi:hypothetical protein
LIPNGWGARTVTGEQLTGRIDSQVLQPFQDADGEQVVEGDERGRPAGHADVSGR